MGLAKFLGYNEQSPFEPNTSRRLAADQCVEMQGEGALSKAELREVCYRSWNGQRREKEADFVIEQDRRIRRLGRGERSFSNRVREAS